MKDLKYLLAYTVPMSVFVSRIDEDMDIQA